MVTVFVIVISDICNMIDKFSGYYQANLKFDVMLQTEIINKISTAELFGQKNVTDLTHYYKKGEA